MLHIVFMFESFLFFVACVLFPKRLFFLQQIFLHFNKHEVENKFMTAFIFASI